LPFKKARALALSVLLLPTALSAELFRFEGKVTSVQDGDSITVLHLYQGKRIQRRVRVWGVDCPEIQGQDFGARAKKFTSQRAFGKNVVVAVEDVDHFGRLVGRVALPDGTDLGGALLQAGLAWWYRRFAADAEDLEKMEKAAREARRGLWSRPDAVAPWQWRKARQTKNKEKNKE
jgi:endonuclease YncB( thermonuclease family)